MAGRRSWVSTPPLVLTCVMLLTAASAAQAPAPPPRRAPSGRAGGRTATGAAGIADYSFSETVEKTSAVSGLGSRPSTASLTTSAGGECEIGTPGR